MNKVIFMFALASLLQFTHAQTVKVQISPYQTLKSKAALEQLLKDKVLVFDPKDKIFKLDLKNQSTKSILEQLENDGLLDEEVVAHGPWCE
jgi:hypothetical protein